MSTVAENVSRFTKRKIKGAEVAKSLCGTLDRPSMTDFKWIVWSHQIKDSPVTVQDIDVAVSIWGKNILKLQRQRHSKQVDSGG